MKNTWILLVFGIFIVLSLSFVSAETLVTGKVYTSDSNTVSGASVAIECNHNGTINSVGGIISKDDGTYAVGYSNDKCSNGDSVKVSVTKNDYSGTKTGNIAECNDDISCGADYLYFTIINPVIKQATTTTTTTTSSGGGGGGGSGCTATWSCTDWSSCVNGNQTRTCTKVNTYCYIGTKPAESQTCSVIKLSGSSENSETLQTEENTNETKGTSLGGITGAVIGTLGKTGSIIVGILIVLAIGVGVTLMVRKNKGKRPSF